MLIAGFVMLLVFSVVQHLPNWEQMCSRTQESAGWEAKSTGPVFAMLYPMDSIFAGKKSFSINLIVIALEINLNMREGSRLYV